MQPSNTTTLPYGPVCVSFASGWSSQPAGGPEIIFYKEILPYDGQTRHSGTREWQDHHLQHGEPTREPTATLSQRTALFNSCVTSPIRRVSIVVVDRAGGTIDSGEAFPPPQRWEHSELQYTVPVVVPVPVG
jgi:hypothetical protein